MFDASLHDVPERDSQIGYQISKPLVCGLHSLSGKQGKGKENEKHACCPSFNQNIHHRFKSIKNVIPYCE
jgi:hypothetical protein